MVNTPTNTTDVVSMKLDFQTSTVTLAGRRFPAVGVLIPPTEGFAERNERTLGGPIGPSEVFPDNAGWSVYVPLENGALANLETFHYDRPGLLDVAVYARTCRLARSDNDELWLPESLAVVGGALVMNLRPEPNRLGIPYPSSGWRWDSAEPEWVCEHLDRLSRMPCHQPPTGPQCELVGLSELWQLDAVDADRRKARRS